VNDDAGTVLVVDDDEACRDLIESLLTEAGFGVRSVASGESALSAMDDGPPAAVVLDVDLGGLSGYEVCHRLREQFGEALPVVFVSGKRAEAIDRVAGLLIGADDYITKPFSPDELVARVRRLVEHMRAMTEAEPTIRGADGERAPDAANGHAPGYELTERAREVLSLLATGLDQEAVAERLVISPSTVATHIQRILAKLGVRSRAQAIVVAYREGLTLPRHRSEVTATR
jgi:DNA-binding NarL/FixJ family response regulator